MSLPFTVYYGRVPIFVRVLGSNTLDVDRLESNLEGYRVDSRLLGLKGDFDIQLEGNRPYPNQGPVYDTLQEIGEESWE